MDKEIREIVSEVVKAAGATSIPYSEIKQLYEDVENNATDDWQVEFDGKAYRLIHEDSIEGIFADSLKDLVNDCYIVGSGLPGWIEIDWQKSAQNVSDVDGYGPHFASYDGYEHYTGSEASYYMFRID